MNLETFTRVADRMAPEAQLNALLKDVTDPYQPIETGDVPWAPIFDAAKVSYTPLRAKESFDRRLAIRERLHRLPTKRWPLRILDLGCAQGYFALGLCDRLHSVVGVDHDPANIALCRFLADRRFGDFMERQDGFTVRFECARVEDVMDRVKSDEFDVALGLSVFQHLCWDLGGWEVARDRLAAFANKVPVLFVELAQPGEPRYWTKTLPPTDRDLLAGYSKIELLGRYQSHFSETMRPMYLAIQ